MSNRMIAPGYDVGEQGPRFTFNDYPGGTQLFDCGQEILPWQLAKQANNLEHQLTQQIARTRKVHDESLRKGRRIGQLQHQIAWLNARLLFDEEPPKNGNHTHTFYYTGDGSTIEHCPCGETRELRF